MYIHWLKNILNNNCLHNMFMMLYFLFWISNTNLQYTNKCLWKCVTVKYILLSEFLKNNKYLGFSFFAAETCMIIYFYYRLHLPAFGLWMQTNNYCYGNILEISVWSFIFPDSSKHLLITVISVDSQYSDPSIFSQSYQYH